MQVHFDVFEQEDIDAGKEVWAASVFSFLRGETLASKSVHTAIYSSALCHLGPLKLENWMLLAMIFATVNVVMPYFHCKYANALDEARRQAATKGLAVSQSFQLLDLRQHGMCETFLARRSLPAAITKVPVLLPFLLYTTCPVHWQFKKPGAGPCG